MVGADGKAIFSLQFRRKNVYKERKAERKRLDYLKEKKPPAFFGNQRFD